MIEQAEKPTKITATYTIYPPTGHINPAPFFSQPNASQDKLFSHRMLATPLRQYVIDHIKDPLRKAISAGKTFPGLVMLFVTIVSTAWKIRKHVGKVTRQNSVFKNVHVMLDCAELVKGCHHNGGRSEMVNSTLEIANAVIEHDPYYRHIAYRIAQYVILQAEMGNWIIEPDEVPKVLTPCWDDQKFVEAIEQLRRQLNERPER